MVGIVKKITDENGYNVLVAFKDGSRRKCRQDALKVLENGQETVMNSKPPPRNNSLQRIPKKGAKSDQPQYPIQRYLQGASPNAKIVWAVAAAAIVVLIIAGIAILATPSHNQRYYDCKAAAENEGYKGDSLQKVIQFCVDVQ